MATRCVGLEVGTSAVRLATVSHSRSGRVLEQLGQVPLDPGVVTDGEINDTAAVTAAVSRLVKTAKPGARKVRIGLVNQRTVAREVELPTLPKKEFDQALPLLTADMLPMPTDECVLDFMPYEHRDADGQKTVVGLLVAAPQDAVLDLVDAVEAAGLETSDVTLTPLSTLAAVADSMAPGPEAIIDVGLSMTTVTIHVAGQPRFVRILSRGGRDITSALAEHLSISEADAEAWKCGLWQLWPQMGPADRAATETAVRAALSELVSDVRTSVDFFAGGDGERVCRAYLVGGAASTMGLVPTLAGVLRVPVTAATAQLVQPSRSLCGSARDLALGTALTSAVGLALGVAA